MRLNGKFLEFGEFPNIEALAVNNISHIVMGRAAKKKKPGCTSLLVILGASGFLMLYLAFKGVDVQPLLIGVTLVLFLAIVIILLMSKEEFQITIVMNSGHRFPYTCDSEEAPQLLNQLEYLISSVGTRRRDASADSDGKFQE